MSQNIIKSNGTTWLNESGSTLNPNSLNGKWEFYEYNILNDSGSEITIVFEEDIYEEGDAITKERWA